MRLGCTDIPPPVFFIDEYSKRSCRMLNFIRKILGSIARRIVAAFTLFHYAIQLFYIAYLVYMVCTTVNIRYLYVAMLAVSIVFLIYDYVSSKGIVAIKREKVEKSEKKARKERLKLAKRKKARMLKVKFYASHVIKMFVLASSLYPIIVAPETVSIFSIICTVFMILLWIFLFWLEILKIVISKPKAAVMESLQYDAKAVTTRMGNAKDKVVNWKDTKIESIVSTVKSEKVMKTAEAGKEKIQNLSAWVVKRIPKKNSQGDDDTPLLTENATADENDAIPCIRDERILTTNADEVIDSSGEHVVSAAKNVIIETYDEA